MSSVLLIDDDDDILDLLEILLETKVDCEINRVNSGPHAVEIIKNECPSLVITDYNMPHVGGLEICETIQENCNKAAIIVLTVGRLSNHPQLEEFFERWDKCYYLQKPFDNDELVKTVVDALHPDTGDHQDNFVKIRGEKIEQSFNNIDIYLSIGETKNVKLFCYDEHDHREQLDRYLKKGVNHFFIKKTDFEKISIARINKLSKKLRNKKLSPVEKSLLQFDCVESIHESVRKLGIKEEVVSAVSDIVDSTIEVFEQEQWAWNLLKDIFEKKGYIYQLSVLNSYVSVGIAYSMRWVSEYTTSKLITCSIFQDISLGSDKLAKITSLDSEEYKKLTQEEKAIVKKHPEESAKILSMAPGIRFDFEDVILNHHELPREAHFHRNINFSTISLLECIFIVSNYFSMNLLEANDYSEHTIANILQDANERFFAGNFAKAYTGLKNMFTFNLPQL